MGKNNYFLVINLILFVFLIALSSSLALAISNESLGKVDYYVIRTGVSTTGYVEQEYFFNYTDLNETSFGRDLEIILPQDYSKLIVYVDDASVEPAVVDNYLYVQTAHHVKLNYQSSSLVDTAFGANSFLAQYDYPQDIDFVNISLHLPEGSVLTKGKGFSEPQIYPRPSYVLSDGVDTVFIWSLESIKTGNSYSIFVKYREGGMQIGSILFVSFLAIGIFVFVIIWMINHFKKKIREQNHIDRKQNKAESVKSEKAKKKAKVAKTKINQVSSEKVEVEKASSEHYENHLKDDELQIINVLKQRDGSCEQGTLRIVTNMSKATMSKILTELEARNIIVKEKKGKKNIVHLRQG